MNQEMNQLGVEQEMNQLGVEVQNERRVFYVFRRGNYATPTVDDTPKYYPREPPSTLLVRQPYAVAIIVPRNLNFELHNE